MELTNAKKKIQERRAFVANAYNTRPQEMAVSVLVRSLSEKFNVTEVQIYNDIKKSKIS